jgi:hypothetical protein
LNLTKEYTMDKNYPKHNTYQNAFAQIDSTIKSGFFLEAITIEESILTDRLLRFCRDHKYNGPFTKITLGGELGFLRGKEQLLKAHSISFIEDLGQFWGNRCTCLHQIAKSEPGTLPIDYGELTELAKKTAIEDINLANKMSNWAKKYKKKNVKITL